MKRRVLVALLCIGLYGCFDKSDTEIKHAALIEVKSSLGKSNKDEPCASMSANKYTMFGNESGKALMKLCGYKFDLNKEINIASSSVHRSKAVVVCGVVSGVSRAGSKIGARFVYIDGNQKYVFIKPDLRFSSDVAAALEREQLQIFNQIEHENCK